MKTAQIFRTGAFFLALTGLALTSCKKDKLEEGKNDSTSLTQLSNDEINVEEITNDALRDVEGILSYNGGNLKSTDRIPCNATVDSTAVVNDTITIYITYDGLSCNGRRYRTGQVQIKKQAGSHWGMEGASVNVKYINFSVTRVANGNTIVLNSDKTFTNVTGGFIYMLGQNGFTSLVHRVNGYVDITFENGTTRTWNIARQRTYTGMPEELVLTVDGFGTAGEYSNLVVWGTNRNGEEFYTQINQSVVHKEVCEWHPVSGIKVHQIPGADKSATITFGYDSNNQPVTNGDCPTHYRIDWQNGTYTGTRFVPFP
jgi:hypothetical protein